MLPYLNWLIQQMYQMSIGTLQVITLHIFTLIFPAPTFADKNGQIRDFLKNIVAHIQDIVEASVKKMKPSDVKLRSTAEMADVNKCFQCSI